jgi:hypothetical protein
MIYKSGKPCSFRFHNTDVFYRKGDKIKTEHEEYLKTYYSGRVADESNLLIFNDKDHLYYVHRGVARTLKFGDFVPEEDIDYILKYHWDKVKAKIPKEEAPVKSERKSELDALKSDLKEQTNKLNLLIDLLTNQQPVQPGQVVETVDRELNSETSTSRPTLKKHNREVYEISLKRAINTEGLESSGIAGDREIVGAKIDDKLAKLAKLKKKKQKSEDE